MISDILHDACLRIEDRLTNGSYDYSEEVRAVVCVMAALRDRLDNPNTYWGVGSRCKSRINPMHRV